MRRSSVALTQKEHELAQSIQLQRQKSDGIGPLDIDENYLMFGGDKSLEDIVSQNSPIRSKALLNGYKQKVKAKIERNRRMSVKVTHFSINKLRREKRTSEKSKFSKGRSSRKTVQAQTMKSSHRSNQLSSRECEEIGKTPKAN